MMLTKDEETIIAQCSPHGAGAIALIRIVGNNAVSIANTISKLASSKSLAEYATHTIHYGSVIHPDQSIIDNVLFLLMRGPKTFTGQDTVEITCHNNPFIIEAIIAQAMAHGARLADNGEFTKRAVLNNKIDLVQAEAINELIHANTQAALKQSLAQLEGSLSHWVTSIEKNLIKALAFCEASFEFIEEENMEFGRDIANILTSTLTTINTIKQTFNQQQHIRNGIRIALIGSVNAGKSSLFNALVGHNRSIVTNIAGTTRDVIEAGLYKNGNYWTLIDTAGLRQTDDSIEQEGIKRSYDEAHKADIIILVIDGSRILSEQELIIYDDLVSQYRHKIIAVHTKNDLPQIAQPLKLAALPLSHTNKAQCTALERAIQTHIEALFTSMESPFLLNQRQFKLILELEERLRAISNMVCQKPIAYELVSYHLNDALAGIAQITGKTISEEAMDAVFRQFCVGK